MAVDTHCHLTHERYEDDRDAVLERALAAGVGTVVSIASDLTDAKRVLDLVSLDPVAHPASPRILGTAGVHPHQASGAPSDLREQLSSALATHPGVVALGECGLDFHYDFSPRNVQHRVFDIHLEAADLEKVPLVVHCREAEEEMAILVRQAGDAGIRGVLHCFPGDVSLFEAAMEAGWMISFTGMTTFRSFEGADVVRAVPAGRYMVETDGPYMAPVPHRGKRNEPAWIPDIVAFIAGLRGETPDVVDRDTSLAASRFFGFSLDH